MKSRSLVLMTGVLTLGFGYWLSESARDAREIWISMGAWILGFWFASSLLGLPRDSGDDEGDDQEQWDDEEYEDA